MDARTPAQRLTGLEANPEQLRNVAEGLRQFFPHPFAVSEAVLIDVDPHRVHAFWNVLLPDVRAARAALAGDGDDAPLVLRMRPSPEGDSFDVEVQGLQGQTYVDIFSAPRVWHAEVGLRRSDGSLVVLGSAEPVTLPVGHAADAPKAAAADDSRAVPAAAARQPVPEPGAFGVIELPEPRPDPFPVPPGTPGELVPAAMVRATTAALPSEAGEPRPSESMAATPAATTHAATSAAPSAAGPAPHGPESSGEGIVPAPRPDPFPAPPGTPDGLVPAGTPMEPPAHVAEADGAAETRPAWDVEPRPDPFPAPPGTPDGAVPQGTPTAFPGALDGDPGSGATDHQPAAHGGEAAHGEPAPNAHGNGHVPGDGADAAAGDEPVINLSSFVFGQTDVQFEVNAELHIFGRAKPGSELHLFGDRVTLRPDGTFSIHRPLPKGAIVMSALLAGVDDKGQ